MERVAGVIRGIEPNDSPERFRGLGVDVMFGDGRFVGPDAFEVDGRRLTAKTFVIATGSRPAIPKIPGLEATPYLTNETLFDLREPVPRAARRRCGTDRLRDGTGFPATGERRHRRRRCASHPSA
jgi:pyruvate/2-oxoglutarate dehydrogenase complex dihydrolipoamide dehydrogenase (E3) component